MKTLLLPAILLILSGTELAYAQSAVGPVQARTPTSGFSSIGTHPDAALQPTARGRRIRALEGWNGLLYAGFGDTAANTGPIAITPYDPITQAFLPTGFLADTEAISNFRPLAGSLYAACDDPGGSSDYIVGEPWINRNAVSAYHLWDMGTLTGTDLWLTGMSSPAASAVIWRSTNGGQTWGSSLELAAPANHWSWFAFVGVYHGQVWVQAFDWNFQNFSLSAPRNSSMVFDGTSWTQGPDLLPVKSSRGYGYDGMDRGFGHRPMVFAPLDLMIYSNGLGKYMGVRGYTGTSPLYAFDGTQPVVVWDDALDFIIDGRVLYTLTVDHTIHFTTDLVRWHRLAAAPADTLSIAMAAGRLLAGGDEGRLYRYDGPLPPP